MGGGLFEGSATIEMAIAGSNNKLFILQNISPTVIVSLKKCN